MKRPAPRSTSGILKPKPQNNSLQIPCPVCGKLFKKSASIALEVHVFRCLEMGGGGQDGLQVQQHKVKISNTVNTFKSIDENHQVFPSASAQVKVQDEMNHPIATFSNHDTIPSIKIKIATEEAKDKVKEAPETAKQKKPCPFYKKLSPTSFTMDAFCYGVIPDCTAYFLSHFHSDHYMGLTGKFNFGPIYCSPVTAALIQDQLRVKPEFINIIPLDTPFQVQGVSVRLLDANHCPGAAIFLFEIPVPEGGSLKYLHTGDFRASRQHWTNPLLLEKTWDKVYLDTTYCKPVHSFPDQQQVLDVVGEVARRVDAGECLADMISTKNLIKNYFSSSVSTITSLITTGSSTKKNTIFVVGTYLIGKEKVWMEVSKQIHSKVNSEKRKMKVYKILGKYDKTLNDVLSEYPSDARVHVVPMNHINHDQLLKLKGKDNVNVLAFRPTGWTFSSNTTNVTASSAKYTIKSLKPVYLEGNIAVIPLPYSEHSSYSELETFCTTLRIKQIIPTVNLDPKSRQEMSVLFASWKQRSNRK